MTKVNKNSEKNEAKINEYLANKIDQKYDLISLYTIDDHWVFRLKDAGWAAVQILNYCPGVIRISSLSHPVGLRLRDDSRFIRLGFEFSFAIEEYKYCIDWLINAIQDYTQIPDWMSDINITKNIREKGLKLGDRRQGLKNSDQLVDYCWSKRGNDTASKYFQNLRNS